MTINNDNELILALLSKLGIDKDQITISKGEIIEVTVSAPEDLRGIFIGKHAQTLDSIQLIISLIINNKKSEHQRILLDIGDYRKRRYNKIKDLAEQVSSLVTSTGQPKALSYLSPTERRQVHMMFKENDKLTTFSQGEGQDRRLFIAPKN